jgi:hypothetical protein
VAFYPGTFEQQLKLHGCVVNSNHTIEMRRASEILHTAGCISGTSWHTELFFHS